MVSNEDDRHGVGLGYLGAEIIMQAARDIGLFTRCKYIRGEQVIKKSGPLVYRMGCTPQETLEFFQNDLRRLEMIIDAFELELDAGYIATKVLGLGGISGKENPRSIKSEVI